MTAQLIPPPDLDHPLPDDLSREQLVALWLEILETSDQLLRAGMQATVPAGVDLVDAYRNWCDQYDREHFEMLERMAERFSRAQAEHGGIGCSENT
jgi:hypothetical protein